MFYIFVNLFCMHIFIVQRIDLEFRSMHYIKIDIIVIIHNMYMGPFKCYVTLFYQKYDTQHPFVILHNRTLGSTPHTIT